MSTLEFKDGYDVLRHVIASLPRQSGYQTFKGVFSKIDEDKSGMLDGVEMKNALAKITGSIKDEHIDLVMATLDSDKDGEVSYEVCDRQKHCDLSPNSVGGSGQHGLTCSVVCTSTSATVLVCQNFPWA